MILIESSVYVQCVSFQIPWNLDGTSSIHVQCTMYLHTCTCTSSSCHLVGHNVVVPPLFCGCSVGAHIGSTHTTLYRALCFSCPYTQGGHSTPWDLYANALSSVLCLQGTYNILMITSMYMYICTCVFIGASIFYLHCV